MVRCAPGARRTDVVADRDVFLSLVRNAEDVRNGRHAAASGTPCAPGVRLPRNESTVLHCANFHTGVSGRPSSCNFELRITLQHDTDRLAASLFGDFGGKDSPTIRGELAAEASPNVVLVNTNVGGWNFQRFCHLAGNAGDILRGNVGEQVILIGPFGNRPMASRQQ